MKKLLVCLCGGLLVLGLASSALSEKAGILKGDVKGVSYMCGGVSKGERAEMEAKSGDYNLKIVLATLEGSYLAKLPVSIQDEEGNQVLELKANGPWVYVKLPDGRYTVRAIYIGEKKRVVEVDEGLETVMLHWKQ